jgi:HD-like signal output (HDOD) protein
MIKAIDNAMDRMGALNYTLPKVLRVVNDMNSSALELVRIIQMDPVLTARVLKVSNSSYFGVRAEPISNLRRATILMGMNTIRNLALATAVKNSFEIQSGGAVSSEDFWRHSVAVAVLSDIISKRSPLSRKDGEKCFVVGMLHLIGRALLIQHFSDEFMRVVTEAKANKCSATEVEQSVFSTNHKKIGMRLAARWKLPDEFLDGVAFYDTPNESDRMTTWIVAVASAAVKRRGSMGFIGDFKYPVIPDAIYEAINISESEVMSIVDSILVVELDKADEFIRGD